MFYSFPSFHCFIHQSSFCTYPDLMESRGGEHLRVAKDNPRLVTGFLFSQDSFSWGYAQGQVTMGRWQGRVIFDPPPPGGRSGPEVDGALAVWGPKMAILCGKLPGSNQPGLCLETLPLKEFQPAGFGGGSSSYAPNSRNYFFGAAAFGGNKPALTLPVWLPANLQEVHCARLALGSNWFHRKLNRRSCTDPLNDRRQHILSGVGGKGKEARTLVPIFFLAVAESESPSQSIQSHGPCSKHLVKHWRPAERVHLEAPLPHPGEHRK